MESLIVFVVFFLIGVYVIKQWVKSQRLTLDAYVDDAIELYKKYTIPLRVELQENGCFYCYNTANDNFVCQGLNIEEIKANFKTRYPNYGSYITHESLHYFPNVEHEPDLDDEDIKYTLKQELKKRANSR